jgi:CRISPR-associated protein Csm4
MRLYRLKLRPLSPWITPWQSDTLVGMLCWTAARCWKIGRLHAEILEPVLNGEPPFVLSDAFPGDLLPIPITLRLQEWADEALKRVKRARWLPFEAFRHAQKGESLDSGHLLAEEAYETSDRLRNTLDRATGTTGDDALFSTPETVLNTRAAILTDAPYLSVYLRIASGYEARVLELFQLLALTGFGADVSAGRGAFEVASDLEPMDELGAERSGANGIVVLSTFQPAEQDPTDGYWELFTKYGKLGPDYGLENVFKRPLIMIRPGACFRCASNRGVVGRAIPMSELLPEDVGEIIASRGADVLHLAYGLALPFSINEGSV